MTREMQKRRYGRIRADGVSTHLRSGGAVRPGLLVENLSLGGAFIRTFDLLPIGSKVSLELQRAGLKQPLRLLARVVSMVRRDEASARRLPPGLAVAFEPHSGEVRTQLRTLLEALAPGTAALDGDLVDPDAVAGAAAPAPRPSGGSRKATELEFRPPPSAPNAPKGKTVIKATVGMTENEARLLRELSEVLGDLELATKQKKALETENQKLRDELQNVRRALFQVRRQ